MTLVSPLNTRRYIPSAPTDLYMSSFFRFPDPPLLRVSLQCSRPSYWSHGPGIPIGLTNKDRGEEDIEYLSLFHVSCHQTPCAIIHHQAHIFPSLPFAADTPAEALLIAFVLHIPCQIQLQASFGFPNPVSPYSSKVICPCFNLIYASFLRLIFVRSSLVIHAGPRAFKCSDTRADCC